jgi:hypothetical protein
MSSPFYYIGLQQGAHPAALVAIWAGVRSVCVCVLLAALIRSIR